MLLLYQFNSALDEFKDTASGLDSETLAASFGVPKEIIETLGISDLASIFTNPPPGIDELVALTKIFQYADEKGYYHRLCNIKLESAIFTSDSFKS